MAIKLIVQIPCYNEAETLPAVIADIPRSVPGVDGVEVLVIDDGSDDATAAIAREAGADHLVRHRTNLGLARSFQSGIEACLRLGADLIVNTDGDNQYDGACIPDLIEPLLDGRADVVIGDRDAGANPDFSWLKRRLQRLGSAVVRTLASLDVNDTVSGFRAYTRDAALKINVMTRFSYTVETLIHAGNAGLSVVSVPVRTRRTTRPSRLFHSIPSFLSRQLATMVRSFTMYRPLRAFALLGAVMVVLGIVPIVRFLWFYLSGDGDGHVQSLVLGSMLFAIGYVTWVIALLGDTISTNRRLLENTLERVRRIELELRDRRSGSRGPSGDQDDDGD